ncbi:MAG: SDR family NAD(P)-dependent oxidoreductase [Ferruginibacter sp.]
MQQQQNKILITGGASGIGFGMAERFIRENNTVIICGRRAEALAEAADKLPGLITKECDLALENNRVELFKWISAEHSDLNVLVNNAGIQHWMSVSDADFFTKAKQEITTNIEAPLHLTSLFLELKSPTTIMNVTSGLSFVPSIRVPVYSATKAFFHSFTLSLQALLASRNIEVIEVVPPGLNTDLGGKGIHDIFPPVSDFIESIFNQLKESKTQLTFGTSEAVSKAGQEILQPIFARLNQLT